MLRVFKLAEVAGALFLLGAAQPQMTVKVGTGLLSGVTDANGVTAYLGIPYAAPPVGELRWRPPQPAAKWEGVQAADHFGRSCAQSEPGSRLPWTAEFMTQGPIGEDCLFLSVWTSAKSANDKRAVMFWIYGGGFSEGSSSVAVYNGANLAKQGVVMVSANYRVGPLGFLVYPELTKESEHHSSGNYGLLDQIAALQWVHRNIAQFGGDPNNVTIFGQSAGAISVADLLRSPLAKGLFARAIAESGPGLFPDSAMGGGAAFEQREQQGVKFAESKGAHSLAQLRALPAMELFKDTPPLGGGPVTDGWVLTADQPEHEVPLVVGMVSGDAAFAGGFGPTPAPRVANYVADAQKKYGDESATFLKLYPATSDADVPEAKKQSQIDQARTSIDVWCESQERRSGTVYTYYFDRAIPWPAHPEFGAFHSAEVPYIFETTKLLDRPWTPVDAELSEMMSSYWTNYAKTGDPNAAGLPPWPQYSADSHKTMELGEHTGAIPDAEPAKLQFFLGYLKK